NLVRQARLIRSAELEHRTLSIDYTVDQWRAMTEVTIYVADWRGLVSQLAGALALSGASIVDARIFTLKNGMALDSLTVQDLDGEDLDLRPPRGGYVLREGPVRPEDRERDPVEGDPRGADPGAAGARGRDRADRGRVKSPGAGGAVETACR